MAIDDAIEGALNEGEDPGSETREELPPTSEEQPEPSDGAADPNNAGDPAEEKGVKEQPVSEEPNQMVPRQALDAVREELRTTKALLEAINGREKDRRQEPEDEPAPDPVDEFLNKLDELEPSSDAEDVLIPLVKTLVAQNRELTQRVGTLSNHTQQSVVERIQAEVDSTVDGLKSDYGCEFSPEEVDKLIDAGKSMPGKNVKEKITQAARVLFFERLLEKKTAKPEPKPDPLKAVRQGKDKLPAGKGTAPAVGTKKVNERMSLDDAINAAIHDLGTS